MWWKKNKAVLFGYQQRMRSRFLDHVVKVQRRCADYLHRKDSKLSVRQRKICFFGFMVVACASCAYILADTLAGTRKQPALTVTPLLSPSPRRASDVPRFSKDDTLVMRRFRALVDSLSATPGGKKTLEAYFAGRPGLLDSFARAEKMFR